MSSIDKPQHRRPRSRSLRLVRGTAAAAAVAVVLAGCSMEEFQRGYLPTEPGMTNHSDSLMDLWVGSWVASLAVGILTWGLTIWCLVAYRRKKGTKGFPRQTSYHLPLEIMYTALPLFMVLVFFFYTDKTQQAVDARVDNPDVVIDAYGKQWSWDFNYVKEDTYSTGVQAQLDGTEGQREKLPTLYLPVDKQVELRLHARDVIHSFWVPAFLQKRDMIPGSTTYITLKPQKEGVYDGKCAELCGEYHSEMLFKVAVVSQSEYDEQMAKLREQGNVGQLGNEYNRNLQNGGGEKKEQ